MQTRTAQPHNAAVAYLAYLNMLESLPPEVDFNTTQIGRLTVLGKDLLDFHPKDLAELIAKSAALERRYEGCVTSEAFESIAADLERLAGEA